MHKWILPFGFCIALLGACGDGAEEEEGRETVVATAVNTDLPPPLKLDGPARSAASSWAPFAEFESRMAALLQSEEPEETRLIVDELLERTREIDTSQFPEPFDRPSVRSRLKVVRTFLLKTQADFHYRQDPAGSMVLLATAYNAWREQLNRATAYNLDPKIFDK